MMSVQSPTQFLVSRLRIHGTTSPLQHMPSRHAKGHFHLYLHFHIPHLSMQWPNFFHSSLVHSVCNAAMQHCTQYHLYTAVSRGKCILTGSTEQRYFKADGSMEKKWDTVIPADLKRLFVSGTYMSRWSRKS